MIRRIIILSLITIGAVIAAHFLSGCQGYQPPGQDLWLALPRK